MAGVAEDGSNPGRDVHRLVVVDATEQRDRRLGVVHVVERLEDLRLDLRRLPAQRLLRVEAGFAVVVPSGVRSALDAGIAAIVDFSALVEARVFPAPCPPLRAPPPVLRLFDLDLGAVEQDEAGKLDRCVGREDRAAEALLHEQGYEAAVVEVRVGQQEGIDLRGAERQGKPVAGDVGGRALEHPAVDEDPGAVGREQELGSGDGGRAADELQLHRVPRSAIGGS